MHKTVYESQYLREEIANLRAEIDALRSKQDNDATYLKNTLKDAEADLEMRIDSVAMYIAMKERGNISQVTRSQLSEVIALEDRSGLDIYWMPRFVRRYMNYFNEVPSINHPGSFQ